MSRLTMKVPDVLDMLERVLKSISRYNMLPGPQRGAGSRDRGGVGRAGFGVPAACIARRSA